MTTRFIKNIDYVILLAKWYIHRNVYLKRNIDLFNFLIVLKSHLDTEKYKCTCNGRLHTFNIRGLRYMNVFSGLLFNSLFNFCLYLVYCYTIFIVQLCFFLANVIFTPVNSLTQYNIF